MATLTRMEQQVLDLAGRTYRFPGSKESAIRAELELSSVRFHQVLMALLDRPEALAYAPVTVHRLRRLRDRARADRSRRSA